MDFRIIEIDGYQVLLERIEDDGQWRMVIGVYIDVIDRFDEWVPGRSAQDIRALIAAYDPKQALLFVRRAKAWWHQHKARQLLTSVS